MQPNFFQPRQLEGFNYSAPVQDPYQVFAALNARQAALQQQQLRQANQPQPKKKRSLVMSLLPAAGAIGAGLAAAPFTGGTSLLGTAAALGIAGGIGGAAGELGAQKLNKEQLNVGNVGKEGLTSALLGAGGAAFSGARGLKAAKAAGAFGDDASRIAVDVARGATRAKDVGNIVSGVGASAPAARGVASRGIGAFDTKEGLRAIPNASQRVATAQAEGIKSGFKGLQQATQRMSQYENQLTPLLTKARVPVKNLTGVLDNIATSTSADVSEATLKRSIASAKQAIANAAKGDSISAADLRNIRSTLGQDIFKGTTTASKELKQEIYRAYGDVIGTASPKAKAILTKQHDLLDLAPGLAARSKDVGVPFLGTRVNVPALNTIRDRSMDAASKVGGSVTAVRSNPAVPQAVRQLAPRAVMGMGAQPQEQPLDVMPQDQTQLEMQPEMMQPQGFDQPPEDAGLYSQEALAYDVSRDPKNASTYMSLFKTLQAAQEASKPSKKAIKAQDAAAAGNQALNIVDSLEQSFGRAGGGQGRIPGLAATIAGKAGFNNNVNIYNDSRLAFLSQVARTLGEKGVLTDRDIERIARAFPSPTNNPQEAAAKWAQIRSIIRQGIDTSQSAYDGGSATPDLTSALMSSQYEGMY